ncbi:MAG: FprA family A-type flavoprotein [Clostridia bacterium]|nr:FprA family A-type flavoprotein [Clostridia bacterium]
MYCVKEIKQDVYWVGGNDRRLALFENLIPIPNGISYNSYLIKDEKTVLIDAVDQSVSGVFFENIEYVLEGKSLDYLIVNHMEPDHCAAIGELIFRYPDIHIVGNSKTILMLKQFFTFDVDSHAILIKEGETLTTGKHTFKFIMAPMVHWPETMVTYDQTDKALYSGDAFGAFKALSGNLFADEINFECTYLEESRRYYTNIVGKYGKQVQALLEKAKTLDIELLCPLHGPLWRENIEWMLDKYQSWSTYSPEEEAVLIAYGSIYGNTENAANILAFELGKLGVRNIAMYDTSVTHVSYILSEAFRCSHIVFASATYNAEIFMSMKHLLSDLKSHNFQGRKIALIENGTWAPTSGKLMAEILSTMAGMEIIGSTVSIKSSVKSQQLESIKELAAEIAKSLHV